MVSPKRGDVFNAPFLYTDLAEGKLRPICIVSADDYNTSGADVVVAMITSRHRFLEEPGLGDVPLHDWQHAGLARPSTLRAGRLQSIEVTLLDERFGTLTARDLQTVSGSLAQVLDLAS